MYHNVKFLLETNESEQTLRVYRSINVEFKDNELFCKDGGGDFSLYLKDSYLCLELDSESKRVGGLSGLCPVKNIGKGTVSLPDTIISGILYMDQKENLLKGTGWRIGFDCLCYYDKKSHNLLIGKIDNDKPLFQCLANLYVQLKDDNELSGIIVSDVLM